MGGDLIPNNTINPFMMQFYLVLNNLILHKLCTWKGICGKKKNIVNLKRKKLERIIELLRFFGNFLLIFIFL